MFKEKFEREHRQKLESYRTAVRYFKAHPEFERMKIADVDGRIKLLQSRIEQGEEALPALRQSLQPYLQVQKYLCLATEPPPKVEREKMLTDEKQREPMREEAIRREPEHRKKRSNELSL